MARNRYGKLRKGRVMTNTGHSGQRPVPGPQQIRHLGQVMPSPPLQNGLVIAVGLVYGRGMVYRATVGWLCHCGQL